MWPFRHFTSKWDHLPYHHNTHFDGSPHGWGGGWGGGWNNRWAFGRRRACHRFGYYHGMYGGGPSRALWFILGGATVAWWMGSRQEEYRESNWCSRKHRAIQRDRAKEAAAAAAAAISAEQEKAKRDGSPVRPPPIHEPGQLDSLRWERERERLTALSNQAADAMADMSEATLDSVLSTVEQLKVKLAQHRVERENFLNERTATETLEAQKRKPGRSNQA